MTGKANFLFWILLAVPAAASVDYVREVKPILKEHCYRCHGAVQQKSALRIDTAALGLKGGDTGPAFKPGKGSESLMIQLLRDTHPEITRMPYKKPPLNESQIALIERWINEGAIAPADEAPEAGKHWSLVPPVRPDLPSVRTAGGDRNPVDRFILARLEKEGIKPAPEADRLTLLRRVSLDLTGLPPTPAEQDQFLGDMASNAYERLVDRLLESPHYAERWARRWLDQARYADSNGYSIDAPRSIWKYRDWVINAFQQDLPFDQFIVEQIAGDLLPNATLAQKIATGFNRNTQINQEGGIDPEQFRIESVLDRVNTTGTAFLGLTVGCAQCHDHKFDPITQKDYYQMFAFFNNTIEDGHGKSVPEGMLEIPNESDSPDNLATELQEAEGDLDRILNTKGSDVVKWEESLTEESRGKLRAEVRKALETPFAQRTFKQKRTVYAAFKGDDPEFKERNAKVLRLERRQPKPVTTLVMVEKKEPRESFIFIKGDFTRHGEPVRPGFPSALELAQTSAPEAGKQGAEANRQLNRLDLARWLASRENPLTARVAVNRIWQEYFGRGLVETENDFGTQGSPPSHPELLDWLAMELMEPSAPPTAKPWSLKHIHRLITTSAVYRQSSRVRRELAVSDPNNRLLARQSRLRLDAEIVRDVCLSASGLLNDKVGGPSVYPPQPSGVMTLGQSKRDWTPSKGADRYRRATYTFFWRATPHPSLMVFDSPDSFSTCTRRPRSNTPLQALTLLNDEAFFEFAQALAGRILRDGGSQDEARLDYGFRLCLGRHPAAEERQRLLDLLAKESAAFEKSPDEAAAMVNAKGEDAGISRMAAWTAVARVLLNLDETITRE